MKYHVNRMNALKGHTKPRALELNQELMNPSHAYSRTAREAVDWYRNAAGAGWKNSPISQANWELLRQSPYGIYAWCWVVAALSPNNTWKQNVNDANAVISAGAELLRNDPSKPEFLETLRRTDPCYAYEMNRIKTVRFLFNYAEDPVLALLPPPGRKVGAFYQALVDNACALGSWAEFPETIREAWASWGEPPVDLWMRRAYLHPSSWDTPLFTTPKSYDVVLYGMEYGYKDFLANHLEEYNSLPRTVRKGPVTPTFQQYQAMIWTLIRRGAE